MERKEGRKKEREPVPSTSGLSAKKRKEDKAEKQKEVAEISEQEIGAMLESFFSDEDDSDSDWAWSELDESEESESEEEDTGADTSPHFRTSTPIPSALPACSGAVRDSSVWVADQPHADPFVFADSQGLKELPEGTRPRDFFNLLATDGFYDHIVKETNAQAEKIFFHNPSPQARITQWKELAVGEFQIFLGLLYHMGTIRLNRLNDYWRKGKLFDLKCFSNFMVRDRFQGILQALHFSRNPEANEPLPSDRLYKIRPLIDLFHERMRAIYTPRKELCVDESMVLWRGRLIFRQYIKNKCHRYGLKVYMLTEPSGLVLKFIVYTGQADSEVGGRGHVDKVVHKLLEGREGLGHAIYMDNFYSSVKLAEELLDKKIYCTGTLRADRKGNPADVLNKKLGKGEEIHRWNDKGVCVLKWKDRRDVLMISSEFGSRFVEVPNRRGVVRNKPEAIAQYNTFMGGIDLCDQLLSYYPCERKAMKWYKKLAINIFQLMLINSFILYNKYSTKKISLYDFRLEIINSLLPDSVISLQSSSRISVNHFPDFLSQTAGKRRNQKRCRVCYAKGVRKNVTTYCPDCSNEPGLCLRPCFLTYHKDL